MTLVIVIPLVIVRRVANTAENDDVESGPCFDDDEAIMDQDSKQNLGFAIPVNHFDNRC